MDNVVVCVYQDCPLCGDRGKKVQEIVADKGVNLRKVSFASPEGRELIFRAMSDHGIKTMPFYVKDSTFSTDITRVLEPLEESVVEPKKPAKKRVRKTKKVKEANGVDV